MQSICMDLNWVIATKHKKHFAQIQYKTRAWKSSWNQNLPFLFSMECFLISHSECFTHLETITIFVVCLKWISIFWRQKCSPLNKESVIYFCGTRMASAMDIFLFYFFIPKSVYTQCAIVLSYGEPLKILKNKYIYF